MIACFAEVSLDITSFGMLYDVCALAIFARLHLSTYILVISYVYKYIVIISAISH